MNCEHCGGSGILAVVATYVSPQTGWDDQGQASACHGCEMGKTWIEVGLVDG